LKLPQYLTSPTGLNKITQLGAKGKLIHQVMIPINVFIPKLPLFPVIDPHQHYRQEFPQFGTSGRLNAPSFGPFNLGRAFRRVLFPTCRELNESLFVQVFKKLAAFNPFQLSGRSLP